MKHVVTILSVALLGGVLSGCAENTTTATATTQITGPTYAATNPKQVQILCNQQRPQKPYQKIGVVSVDLYDMSGYANDPSDINKAMCQQAARIGGDAVINIEQSLGLEKGTVISYHKPAVRSKNT